MDNKTRFLIMKTGYVTKKGTIIDPIAIASYKNEINAIAKLKEMAVNDSHYIQKEIKQHIANGIYDWNTDSEYGQDGIKWLHDISK